MTRTASRCAALAALALTSTVAAAPTVSPARVVLDSPTPLVHAPASEALVGNGTDLFGAFVQTLYTGRTVLRGTFFADDGITPDTASGVVISGSDPSDHSPAAGSQRATLTMNARGTVLGVYAQDVFRVGRDGAIASVALTAGGLPAAPLFPTVGGLQAAVIVGDSGAGAAGAFLFVSCTPTECTMQRIDDLGAPVGAEATLFTFTGSPAAPALVAATYVPTLGFRVVAAQGQQVQTALVAGNAAPVPSTLADALAPDCPDWAITSVRVGHGAAAAARARITTTCDSVAATWLDVETKAATTEPTCGAAAGPDDCTFVSSDAGLFVTQGATLYSTTPVAGYTLPTWSGPLRAAPAPSGALAVAANVPAIAHVVPPAEPVDGSVAWRALTMATQAFGISGSATDTANAADFRAAFLRGEDRILLRGDSAIVPLPEEATGTPVGVADTTAGGADGGVPRTFVGTNTTLSLLDDTNGTANPFGGLLTLGHAGDTAIALGMQNAAVSPLLYAYRLDAAAFGPPTGGVIPGAPAGIASANLISAVDAGSSATLAYDGAHFLAVFTRAQHLDAVLLNPDATLAGAVFPISRALYRQVQPRVAALVGGGFFVAWTDARVSLTQRDVYGTYVGADGAVASPQGIAIARTDLDESAPAVAPSPDADHVVVTWTEQLVASPRSAYRVRGAAVSRSAAAARSTFTVDDSAGDHLVQAALPTPTGVAVYEYEYAAPAGGLRVLAKNVVLGKAAGQTCATGEDCVTDNCVKGSCAEPAEPPGSTCADPCAVLDPVVNACKPAPRGSVPTGAGCPGYYCDGTQLACPSKCLTSADCTGDAECESGACKVVRSCTSDTELSDRGNLVSCGQFRCDRERALCFASCTTAAQCAPGLVCGEDGGCVTPPTPAEGGCNVGASSQREGLFLLILTTLAMVWQRRRAAALGALALLAPRAALAADSRVGPSEPLAPLAGTTFASVVSVDTGGVVPLGLPGPAGSGLYRVPDRAGALRDALFVGGTLTGWSPARGGFASRANCADGSVLAIERVSDRGRVASWLLHYVGDAVPTHRIRVPDTALSAITCTSDGAWVQLAEVTDAYERYVWATGASAQRVATSETGTYGFFRETVGGWVSIRPSPPYQNVVVTHADASPGSSFTVVYGLGGVFSIGAGVVVSYQGSPDGENVYPYVGLAAAGADAVVYTESQTAMLPVPYAGSLAPRGDGRSFTYRTGTMLKDVVFPEGPAGTPPTVVTSPVIDDLPGGNMVGYARGTTYEATFDSGVQRQFALADLTEIGAATQVVTAQARALRLGTVTPTTSRLVGYQAASLAAFRTDGTATPLTLPPGTEAQTPSALLGLTDGTAALVTRDAGTFSGHVLTATDAFNPFPLLDAATSAVSLGDGVAALHFVSAATTTYTWRHISATVGDTTKTADLPVAQQEWGLRDVTSVAAVGNEAFGVFARGASGFEQHLDWVRIKQGVVSDNLPLVREFARQLNPKIACDPTGTRGCLVAWEDYRKNDYDPDLYVARILPDGTTPDPRGILVAGSERFETEPSVIWTDDDDHFFVAWRDSVAQENRTADSDPSRIKGAFVRHDGTVEDPGGFDVTDEPLDEMAPVLLAGTRGTFQVAYQVFDGAVATSSNQIALRTLHAGKLRGDGCSTDNECAGRACIDGICCEATCRDGCGTCNQPGQLGLCVPRAKGSESYQDRCGSFLCDGATTSCASTCRDNGDCTGESSCDPQTRQCSGPQGTVCTDDVTEADDAGAPSSCLPFRCLRGHCATRCETAAECAPGSICTLEHQCEVAPPAAEGGCSTQAPSPVWPTAGLGFLLGLGLLRRGRRAKSA